MSWAISWSFDSILNRRIRTIRNTNKQLLIAEQDADIRQQVCAVKGYSDDGFWHRCDAG